MSKAIGTFFLHPGIVYKNNTQWIREISPWLNHPVGGGGTTGGEFPLWFSDKELRISFVTTGTSCRGTECVAYWLETKSSLFLLVSLCKFAQKTVHGEKEINWIRFLKQAVNIFCLCSYYNMECQFKRVATIDWNLNKRS